MGRSGSGWKKKAATWFVKNHAKIGGKTSSSPMEDSTESDLTVKRLTHQQFESTFKLNNSGELTPICEEFIHPKDQTSGIDGSKLRPLTFQQSQVEKSLLKKKITGEVSGYVDVHLPTCVKAVQDCVSQHGKTKPGCTGYLVTSNHLYQKWGVSAAIQLKCNTCSFVSSKHKLYQEVIREGKGRRCAQPNRSLALGLYNTSIATAGAQRLLTSMNKSVPCVSGLQRQLNHVGDIVRSVNKTDMATQRRLVKDTLENAGYDRNAAIPAEADRQYNISLRNSRRRTPFAPATQTRDVIAENVTPEKESNRF